MQVEREPIPGIIQRFFTGHGQTPLEHWPPERLRAYQQAALAEQLAHVEAHNEFYRAKLAAAGVAAADFRELCDLRRFPLTDKDELRGKPWVLLCVPRQEICLTHTSTGTTGGAWSYVHYSWDDMHVRDTAAFPQVLLDVRRSDVVINALPYEMSSAGQSFQRSLQGAVGAQVVPVGKGGFYSEADKTVQVMAELSADVLITTPPYAMLLAEVAAALGLAPGRDIRLRCLWLTGEGCSAAYRRRLEELWQCAALVFYGSLECGPMGIECRRQSGCHVSAGHVYLEIVDPQTGQPLPPGEVGEVVCTTLIRHAAPLIRYRTQDLGSLEDAACPCGVALPRLHLRGRMADQVRSTAGAAAGAGESSTAESPPPAAPPSLSPLAVEEVLYRQAEMGGNYQIYLDGGALRIEAELAPAAAESNLPGAAEAARRRIRELLAGRGITADVTWVEHIPRTGGKTRRLRPLSERPLVMDQRCVLRAALQR